MTLLLCPGAMTERRWCALNDEPRTHVRGRRTRVKRRGLFSCLDWGRRRLNPTCPSRRIGQPRTRNQSVATSMATHPRESNHWSRRRPRLRCASATCPGCRNVRLLQPPGPTNRSDRPPCGALEPAEGGGHSLAVAHEYVPSIDAGDAILPRTMATPLRVSDPDDRRGTQDQ